MALLYEFSLKEAIEFTMTHKYVQKMIKIYSGPDAEIYCQSCYSFEFGTKARTKPKKGFKKLVVIF